MPEYVLIKGSIGGLVLDSGDSIDVKKGQKIQLSEEKARRFRWLKRTTILKEQPKQQVEQQQQPTTMTDVVPDVDWSKYRDMKAPDLIAEIKDTNSMDDLLALKDVEENGQNRIGVLREIEKRVRQLEEETEKNV